MKKKSAFVVSTLMGVIVAYDEQDASDQAREMLKEAIDNGAPLPMTFIGASDGFVWKDPETGQEVRPFTIAPGDPEFIFKMMSPKQR